MVGVSEQDSEDAQPVPPRDGYGGTGLFSTFSFGLGRFYACLEAG